MNYETAKKLKDAGFPQGDNEYCICDETGDWKDCGISDGGSHQTVHKPDLEELIDACGENFKHLCRHNERWKPSKGRWSVRWRNREGKREKSLWGHTPLEAVANLYLALKKEKEK